MKAQSFGAAVAFCFAATFLQAQDALDDMISVLKDKAIVIDLIAKVGESDQGKPWTAGSSKVTIPGRPVSMKLVGANLVIATQFTPYIKADGSIILVAQGQVWAGSVETGGVRYHTIMQTIALSYGERVYFFPLGKAVKGDSSSTIEVQLEVHPYTVAESNDETSKDSGPPASTGDGTDTRAGNPDTGSPDPGAVTPQKTSPGTTVPTTAVPQKADIPRSAVQF